MRIAIDASRTTVARITGTERYAIELIRALLNAGSGHQFTLYFRDPPPPELFPGFPAEQMRVIPQRRVWTHTRFAAAIARDRPDLTFVPAHPLPYALPGRAAVTVHDLGFRYFPAAHPARQRLYLDLTTRYSAARAGVVLADSGATARDLVELYGVRPGKIRVVYPGVTAPPPGDLAAVRARYGLPERYFLFVGTLQPRKNIACLVQSYQRWRGQNPGDEAGLVLAGSKGWLYDDMWAGGLPGLHLTGYIDEADKGALYAGALALVFPSLYEGFGFPVIEAMHCGTPVIASNTSSLPELVADAGLLVDPIDIGAIAAAMTRVAAGEALRADLAERGRARARYFTWDRAAAETLRAFEFALDAQG